MSELLSHENLTEFYQKLVDQHGPDYIVGYACSPTDNPIARYISDWYPTAVVTAVDHVWSVQLPDHVPASALFVPWLAEMNHAISWGHDYGEAVTAEEMLLLLEQYAKNVFAR